MTFHSIDMECFSFNESFLLGKLWGIIQKTVENESVKSGGKGGWFYRLELYKGAQSIFKNKDQEFS